MRHVKAAFSLAAKLAPCVLFVDEARRLDARGRIMPCWKLHPLTCRFLAVSLGSHRELSSTAIEPAPCMTYVDRTMCGLRSLACWPGAQQRLRLRCTASPKLKASLSSMANCPG